MKTKPILIIAGEPKSIFFEILFKSINKTKFRSPLIIIASKKLFLYQVKKFKFSRKVNFVNIENLKKNDLRNRSINFIDIPFKNSKIYIENSFNTAFKILKSGLTNKLINGPINKEKFLNQKYLGITEYIAQKFFSKKLQC